MLVPSQHASRGFTLIELLVVMVVVGLLVALATVSIGGDSLRRDLDNEAEKLVLLMETASEQAILNNSELGLLFDEESYQFLIYQDDKRSWEPSPERTFRSREIPEWLSITTIIESEAPRLTADEDRVRPDIVFFSSGETTPFEVELVLARGSGSSEDYLHRISSDGVADIVWDYPGKEQSEEI